MKSRMAMLACSLAVAIAAGLWGWPAGAQESRADRWEYCVLSHATPGEGVRHQQYVARVTYFTRQGTRAVEIERGELLTETTGLGATSARNDDPTVVQAHAVATLGSQGWEMVALPGGNTSGGIWMVGNGALFKRRAR